MPKITVFPHGINAAQTSAGNPSPPVRGACRGWTQNAALRNERFLMSVRLDELTEDCFTFTFTVRDMPASGQRWDAMKRNLLKRWARRGMIRAHYVTEWQRRGVPHLHGVVFFRPRPPMDLAMLPLDLTSDWLQVAAGSGASEIGQLVRHELDLSVGWFVYLSKHASRGAAHYQRQRHQLPSNWQSTGRMWGVRGAWPTERQEYEVSRQVFFRFRRLMRSYLERSAWEDLRRATARGDTQRIRRSRARVRYLRRFLSTGDRKTSEVRAIAEWIGPEIRDQLLLAALRASPPSQEPLPYRSAREALRASLTASPVA